jgi:uncharacterized protein (TIGR00251 family)
VKPKAAKNGVLITIRVKPNSRRFAIKRVVDQIVVEVKNAPVKGKANEDAIQGLSDFFRKPVQILKGHKSKQKILLIQNVTLPEIQFRLDNIASLS